MNRTDFQLLSAKRVDEAKALQAAGHFSGARYLMGYAVECALKACIAKLSKRHEFPAKDSHKFYVHRLEDLVMHANLKAAFETARGAQPTLATHWNTVKDWSEELRYSITPTTAVEAQDYIDACIKPKTGVLTWIKKQW